MRITAIVLHYGAIDDTSDAVRSLLASSVPSDVIVVNNDCPGSADVMRFPDRPEAVRVIEAETNRGFASGVNLGIRAALERGAEAVFLLNNDAVVEPDTLAELRAAAQERPEFGILAPVVYYADARDQVWSAGWRRRPARLLTPLSTLSGRRSAEADSVAGCAMLIRRSALDRIGLFDERFFLYYEDVDLCRRAWAAGIRVGVVSAASAYHKVSRQPRFLQPSRAYPWAMSKALCYGRARGVAGSFTASFRLAVGILAFAAHSAREGNLSSIPKYLEGTRDGWRLARST